MSEEPPSARPPPQCQPIDQQQLAHLQRLCWGEEASAPSSWRQGFAMCSSGWRGGLQQLENGPCALLAAVQAAMFSVAGVQTLLHSPPSVDAENKALALALSTIICRASSGSCILVRWNGRDDTIPTVTPTEPSQVH